MSSSKIQLSYERVLKLREEAEQILELYPGKRLENFAGNLGEILEELSIYQIELEMQNEELKDIQERLEKAQTRIKLFFDESPAPTLLLSRKGQILLSNPAGIHFLKLDSALRNVSDRMLITPLVHPKDLEVFLKNLIKTPTGSTFETEISFKINGEFQSVSAKAKGIALEDTDSEEAVLVVLS